MKPSLATDSVPRFELGGKFNARTGSARRRTRYTKADVQFHSEHFGPSRPAVNVKVRRSIWGHPLPLELGRSKPANDPAAEWTIHTTPEWFTHEWIEEHIPDHVIDEFFWSACESGWESLQVDAEEIFGSHVKVYGEGRSSGRCVVEGLPDFDSWDATMLAKWRKFEKWARQQADDVPYQMLVMLADYAEQTVAESHIEGYQG